VEKTREIERAREKSIEYNGEERETRSAGKKKSNYRPWTEKERTKGKYEDIYS
jgi:hypothetical protein